MALKAVLLVGFLIKKVGFLITPTMFLVREWRRDKCRSALRQFLYPSPDAKVRAVCFYFWSVGLIAATLYSLLTALYVLVDKLPDLGFVGLLALTLIWCVIAACIATAMQLGDRRFQLRQRVIAVSTLSVLLFPVGFAGPLLALWAWGYFRESTPAASKTDSGS
jgi:hypothetical protein